MPGNDAVATIDLDGIGPAEFYDAGRELGDLRLGMCARIASKRDQRLDLPVLDVQCLGHRMQKPATEADRKLSGNYLGR